MQHIKLKQKNLSVESPIIMGILNLTPDSFSDGGKYLSEETALTRVNEMIKQGADIIDVGAESSRPGAEPVSEEEEIRRLDLLLNNYHKHFSTPLSIDTTKAAVADYALSKGADFINDISGLTLDSDMITIIKKHDCPIILMHMQKTPQSMQDNPNYKDVVAEVKEFFETQIQRCKENNISQIILDPGIGFGKSLEHNLLLLKHLDDFKSLGYPLLIGTSRKSFIEKITGDDVNNRLEGSLVSNSIAYSKGASIFRVHDVAETKKALQVTEAILNA